MIVKGDMKGSRKDVVAIGGASGFRIKGSNDIRASENWGRMVIPLPFSF